MNKKTFERKLKQSAKESCDQRDHNMSNFKHYNKNSFSSKCKQCGLEVYIELNPMPNSTNIFGEAVAVNCKNKYSEYLEDNKLQNFILRSK